MTDFFLLLMLAGAGDELQGMKRGIIEMLDGMAINKADGDNKPKAERARIEYANALHLFPASADGWTPRVLTCSALNGEGIAEVWQMVLDHREAGGIGLDRPPPQRAGRRVDGRTGFTGTRGCVAPQPVRGRTASRAEGIRGTRPSRPPFAASREVLRLFRDGE